MDAMTMHHPGRAPGRGAPAVMACPPVAMSTPDAHTGGCAGFATAPQRSFTERPARHLAVRST